METESLGAKFWLWLIGGVIAGILAMVAIFVLWGLAWYAWGGAVAIVFMISALVLVAWGSDRLVTRRRDVEDEDAGLTVTEDDTSVRQQAMKDRGRVQA